MQGFANPFRFVVAMQNTTNPWPKVFHKSWQKIKFSVKPKPDMCRLNYLCVNLCDMQSTLVNKFSKRCSAHRGIWNKPDNRDDSDQMTLSRHYSVFHGIIIKTTRL